MKLHNLFEANGPKKKITESVIYQLSKENPMDDTEVLVLGGAGRYTLAQLRNKARREADMLRRDLESDHGDAFRRSTHNIQQLTNTLNTIKAAYDELNQLRSKGGITSRGIRQEDLDLVESTTALLTRANSVVRSDDVPAISPPETDGASPHPYQGRLVGETSIDSDRMRSFIVYDKSSKKILQIDVMPRDLPLAVQYAQNSGYDAGYIRQNANHFKGEFLDEASGMPDLDHMPGQVIRNTSMLDPNRKFTDRAVWTRTADAVNSAVCDDSADYKHTEKYSLVTCAGKAFAIWNEKNKEGWVNLDGDAVHPGVSSVTEAFADDPTLSWGEWRRKAKQHGAVKFVDTDNKTIAYDKDGNRVSYFVINLKASKDPIDEISKKTLGSYAKKSADELASMSFSQGNRDGKASAHRGMSGRDERDYDKTSNKMASRKKGLDSAIDRLSQESVGPINEYEKFTDENGVTWNDEGESDAGHTRWGKGPMRKKQVGDVFTGRDGRRWERTATGVKPYKVKEDAEQVNEISKDLAISYNDRADSDYTDRKFGRWDLDPEQRDRKMANREKGRKLAIAKLGWGNAKVKATEAENFKKGDKVKWKGEHETMSGTIYQLAQGQAYITPDSSMRNQRKQLVAISALRKINEEVKATEARKSRSKRKAGPSLVKLALGAMALKWALGEAGPVASPDEDRDNFSPADIKELEGMVGNFPAMKARAIELIQRKGQRSMKPDKVSWFVYHIENRIDSPLKLIKMMYDLLLAGEGHRTIGTKGSMNPNSYRRRFGEAEQPEEQDNFSPADIKELEGMIRDFPAMKARAIELIQRKGKRSMKPDKVSWFVHHIENRIDSPLKLIKMMYDLLLAGEGHRTIGTKGSMKPNSYQRRFSEAEQSVTEVEMWTNAPNKNATGVEGGRDALRYNEKLGSHKLGNGYTLIKTGPDKFTNNDYTYVVTNENNQVTAYIYTSKKGKAEQVEGLYANRNNAYPMYKVYAYIVKNLGITLMSDTLQSDAGKATWHKLSAVPGVTVHGWRNGQAVNLGDKLDSDTDADTHTDKYAGRPGVGRVDRSDNPDPQAFDTVLVATKSLK